MAFFKGEPNEYVIKFTNGRIKRKGRGISFLYIKSRSNIIVIPTSTIDAPFLFNEITKTFQSVTIQGQITYRITEYEKTALILDYSIDPVDRNYKYDDPDKLAQRVINAVQMATKAELKNYELEDALRSSTEIMQKAQHTVQQDPALSEMGVEVLSVYITAITPTPEMSKALEAEYREALQKKADEAIYARRAAAVEQERIIKENEVNSQIAIETKRAELVELNGNNTLKEAEYDAKAKEMEYIVYRNTDPRVLLGMGLKALGENAANIDNLTITPDLISEILSMKGKS